MNTKVLVGVLLVGVVGVGGYMMFGKGEPASQDVRTTGAEEATNGPADGSTAHQGRTRVGYKIQIGSLQEAGTDYTNTLTYVATPTF